MTTTTKNKQFLSWTDLFFGVFTEPIETFQFLLAGGPDAKDDDEAKATAAFFLVSLIHFAIGLSLGSLNHIAISALWTFISIFSGIIFWMILAYLLFLTAKSYNRNELTLVKASTLTGWAHLPLCLYPSIHCVELGFGTLGIFLSVLPIIWFFILQLLAFKIVLDISYSKLFFGAFIAPPIIFLALFYWFYVIVSYATLKTLYLFV